MVSGLGASAMPYEPGRFDDIPVSNEFHFDHAVSSVSASSSDNTFVTPTFDHGEVWALKIRWQVGTEPDSSFIECALMDEQETLTIEKATIPSFGGHDAEVNVIVDWTTAGDGSQSWSPDVKLTAVGDDATNYVVTCTGVRLSAPTDTSAYTATGIPYDSFDP